MLDDYRVDGPVQIARNDTVLRTGDQLVRFTITNQKHPPHDQFCPNQDIGSVDLSSPQIPQPESHR